MAFDSIIRAARQFENSNWGLADELLKHADKTMGGLRGMNAVATALSDAGMDYSASWLSALRHGAELFPPERRHPQVGVRIHLACGSPDMLDAILRIAKREGYSLSLHSVERMMAQLGREERAQREEEAKEAEAEAKEAEKEEAKAKDEPTRKRAGEKKKAAKKRAKKARSAPKRQAIKPPKEENANFLMVRTQVMADLGQIGKLIKKINKTLEPALDQLSPNFCNAAMEECIGWAQELRGLADLIKKNRPSGAKRGHLYAV
jgi:hypothetical protein